jgi:hypothetical protein
MKLYHYCRLWIFLALTMILCGVHFVWVLSWHGYMLMMCIQGKWIQFPLYCENKTWKLSIQNVLKRHFDYLVNFSVHSHIVNSRWSWELYTPTTRWSMMLKQNLGLSLNHSKRKFCFAQNYWAHEEIMWCYVGWHSFGQSSTYVHLDHE